MSFSVRERRAIARERSLQDHAKVIARVQAATQMKRDTVSFMGGIARGMHMPRAMSLSRSRTSYLQGLGRVAQRESARFTR